MIGNTQAAKKPRLLTPEVDPKRLAVWTLPRFSARLCQYVYEVYDQMEHPALFMSPREAFAQGMKLAGMRTHCLTHYTEEFLQLTCPTTRTGCAKLDGRRGVIINGLHYHHPLMSESEDVGKCVPVRYEPFNMARAYAFVEGQWLPCTADIFLLVEGRSEREWEGTSLTEEVLTRTMPHPAKRVSLEMEARAGEHKVALHDSEGAKQFQALLKKPARAANAEATQAQGSRPGPPEANLTGEIAEPASATLPVPQVSPKPTQPRVGQRAPERDLVGETSVAFVRKTAGCSFTEVIPVTLSQMEEAGVSRFECPTCKAVRDIKPKGDYVKFPSHPKRMTNTPNQGSRWVKRESTWRLSG